MTGTLSERMESLCALIENQRAQLEILRQLVEEQRDMITRLKADLSLYADRYHKATGEIAVLQMELIKHGAEPANDFLRKEQP